MAEVSFKSLHQGKRYIAARETGVNGWTTDGQHTWKHNASARAIFGGKGIESQQIVNNKPGYVSTYYLCVQFN